MHWCILRVRIIHYDGLDDKDIATSLLCHKKSSMHSSLVGVSLALIACGPDLLQYSTVQGVHHEGGNMPGVTLHAEVHFVRIRPFVVEWKQGFGQCSSVNPRLQKKKQKNKMTVLDKAHKNIVTILQ